MHRMLVTYVLHVVGIHCLGSVSLRKMDRACSATRKEHCRAERDPPLAPGARCPKLSKTTLNYRHSKAGFEIPLCTVAVAFCL